MTKKLKAEKAVAALEKEYPVAVCSLNARSPFELLVAVRLSAQCTDARVNLVTPALFSRYQSLEDFAAADTEEIESFVKSCGFYHTKARDINAMAQKLITDYNGEIPDTIDELVKLPGVGRKSANLIVGDVFGKPAVVADTHLIRISNLLGLVSTKNPVLVERELKKLLHPDKSNDFCHRCVMHGRAVCVARRPKCDICCMKEICEYAKYNL